MLSILPLFSLSYTWDYLVSHPDLKGDELIKVLPPPSIKEHKEKNPLLIQSKKITERITPDCPFVGIVDCTFESIDLKSEGEKQISLVELQNTKLHMQKCLFTDISNGAAISMKNCYMSVIENTVFVSFKEASAIVVEQSNDITISDIVVSNCEGVSVSCSALKIIATSYVLIENNEFSSNVIQSSPLVVNKCNNVTVNCNSFHNNKIITPGQIYCSASVISITNCKFEDNKCGTYACALLSKDCFITLAHCLFARNELFEIKEYPIYVKNIVRNQVAVCVTIYESNSITTHGAATIFKNLYFEKTGPRIEAPENAVFMQSIDIFYEGPNPKTVGTIETTGDDIFQVIYSSFSDFDNYKFGVKELSWNENEKEPVHFVVDYMNQPLLPVMENTISDHLYSSDGPMSVYDARYSFITIKKCEFSNSNIFTKKFDDAGSFIHINLNNGGYVSIENTTFSKISTVSSIVEVVNTFGVAINDCTFTRNFGRFSSGLLLADVGTARICHTKFEKNTACNNGALTLYRVSNALIINSKFRKNSGKTGPSALVLEDTILSINDTIFVRNKNDISQDRLGSSERYAINETLDAHTKISGVKQHYNMSSTLGAYGSSKLLLNGAVFSDNEDETGLGSEYFNLTGLDGYADPSVEIDVISSCTDTKNMNFNYNWSTSLRYDPRKCDLKKIYPYHEYFRPMGNDNKFYDFEVAKDGYEIKTIRVKDAFIPDPMMRVQADIQVVAVPPPPSRTPYPPPPPIKEGLAPYKTALISIGAICFIVLVAGVSIIYKYRKKPENRLRKRTEAQKSVMDGLINKDNDMFDGPPEIHTESI